MQITPQLDKFKPISESLVQTSTCGTEGININKFAVVDVNEHSGPMVFVVDDTIQVPKLGECSFFESTFTVNNDVCGQFIRQAKCVLFVESSNMILDLTTSKPTRPRPFRNGLTAWFNVVAKAVMIVGAL